MNILLRVLSHLFRPRGRLARRWFWSGCALLAGLVFLAMPAVQAQGGRWAVILAFLPVYWCAFCLMSQRCHDTGRSAAWLFILLTLGVLTLHLAVVARATARRAA